ncbi:MAG: hypothetical protein IIB44_13200 [Candidatus Marinimicrobia bacterium]|nr:hypothetical protein [Candidatus Neomarinimicrobiota bacterium]
MTKNKPILVSLIQEGKEERLRIKIYVGNDKDGISQLTDAIFFLFRNNCLTSQSIIMKLFKIILFLPLMLSAQALNTELMGHLAYAQDLKDIWGYVASDGTEYALVGTYTGTSIVDVSTDPGNPTKGAFISGQGSIWRDIKTYDHYMYVGTEASQGI